MVAYSLTSCPCAQGNTQISSRAAEICGAIRHNALRIGFMLGGLGFFIALMESGQLFP